ncbi:NADH dehydrogenase subunit H [Thermanaeromonas toyohensis ToBE]|uniref:NADH-quinone oxidoreductase subunit H n=1 Tax=Thermanaeromonas toyohensis ToBE TaxID=698762 RepID=A0A1W1VPS0_9FIRM|nr:NADH-quinone oxidoreductase subunit NuoH [Thermanaeromonas toyohensis]SMB95375.1 NADH dehydrogenase subunit H [Thermanaeromonas toyohensis ToBE]
MLDTFLAAWGLPLWAVSVIRGVIYLLGILAFVFLNAIYLIYLERKVSAYMQQRLGPNRVGPRGLFQSVVDAIKLLGKEDIIPREADKWVFLVAPIAIFIPAIMVYAVIPFGPGIIAADLNIGVFYFLAVASTTTIAILMGGWAGNNKYSLLGAMRTVAQMVSYEIPLVFSILGVIMLAGSLKTSDIVAAQREIWFIFLQPIAFLIYFIAATAEVNRGPFDLVEGEQEIIAGPFTEFTAMRYALFYLSEYTNLLSVSALAVTLFFGGWQGPWLPSWLWFIIKVYIMILLFMWVRWTFPRIRIDHLLQFNWKFLLPLSLANILATGIGIKVYQVLVTGGW